jgi:hypothetical protein
MNDTEEMKETQLATSDGLQLVTQFNWDRAGKVAELCRTFVDATAVSIAGKRYIPVEGWQSIAAAWGYTPSTEEPLKTENGYRCKALLKRDSDGMVISEAYGYVGNDEIWKDRAQYANEAMVQTRAISRVCRNKFAFVAVLMKIPHLVTTPAEEVPRGGFQDKPQGTVDPKESLYQGVLEKAFSSDARKDDKDQRKWFNGEINGRKLWTRKPDIGEDLLAAKGVEVVVRIRSGTKPNVYQVMEVQIPDNPSGANGLEQEPDEIPGLRS